MASTGCRITLCLMFLYARSCLGSRPSRQAQQVADLARLEDISMKAQQRLEEAKASYLQENAELDAKIDQYQAKFAGLDEAEESLVQRQRMQAVADRRRSEADEAAKLETLVASVSEMKKAGDPYREARLAYMKRSEGTLSAIQEVQDAVKKHVRKPIAD
mmetsp:Transcript_15308/g.35900  ORF Transcript_15308/g.35900 Transcript_15308/m.35900 type:complete len:160 (-) Transcript_15308:55-534(-)